MPLRDHFHPPLVNRRSWEGFHGQWPAMIVMALVRKLRPGFFAEPRVHLGAYYETDAASYEEKSPFVADAGAGAATDFPDQYAYEVLVYDETYYSRLVAAVEIVSPANKDRPESRRLFVAKCSALLAKGVCVGIVDLVTTRRLNLYGDLLELVGECDPFLSPEPPPMYAVVCRFRRDGDKPRLASWLRTLAIGERLPTLPLWLSDNLFVPLELESSHEESCRILCID